MPITPSNDHIVQNFIKLLLLRNDGSSPVLKIRKTAILQKKKLRRALVQDVASFIQLIAKLLFA